MDETTVPSEHAELLHLLHENLAIAKDNNRLLRDARRIGRIAFWAKVAIWTVVLILPFVLYTYFAPLLERYGLGSSSVFGLPSNQDLQKAINVYKGQYHP